jgi:hypothetical protein
LHSEHSGRTIIILRLFSRASYSAKSTWRPNRRLQVIRRFFLCQISKLVHGYYFILRVFIKYPRFANVFPRLLTQPLSKLHQEVFERNVIQHQTSYMLLCIRSLFGGTSHIKWISVFILSTLYSSVQVRTLACNKLKVLGRKLF